MQKLALTLFAAESNVFVEIKTHVTIARQLVQFMHVEAPLAIRVSGEWGENWLRIINR